MADIRGVWGIDIGLAGLKAIRLVYAEAARQVLATAFDYVPHPKILSQPDANPEELIAQALDTFLSRNSLGGDGVAISVPGQTALARFIQLPPVEASKVVEIVKYEARQQIPFALEEVIWDYQPLGGGVEESGFMLDAEVGLFAMKRDQVAQHMAPFLNRKVEIDLVQIAPLALYNFLCHDQFGQGAGDEASEQEGYTLLLDMGADNTTLLVSNGKKIWIRNVPLGGNHFTRTLTKEMKLTFAKAEHLKCNATKSPDPKAVFQALRPVFNDYVAEIQRSIGYFSSVNREAKITRILGVGNGFKLAGLQKFLQQNLQMDVERVESFPALAGDAVLNAPLFQENLLSFAVPYGLALQGLNVTRVHTSLLPPEIKTARLVRRKKPWAVATAAALLLGLATSTMGYSHVWNTVSTERFGNAEKRAKEVVEKKNSGKTNFEAATAANKKLKTDLDTLLAGGTSRATWIELYKTISECLPTDVGEDRDIDDPTLQNRIRLLSIMSEKKDDLGAWFKELTDQQKLNMRPEDSAKGPSGPGYVFTLNGRHFHYEADPEKQLVRYVVNTLLRNLQQWTIQPLDLQTGEPLGIQIPVRQLGISHATITISKHDEKVMYYKDGPGAAVAAGGGGGGGVAGFGAAGGAGPGGGIPGAGNFGGTRPGAMMGTRPVGRGSKAKKAESKRKGTEPTTEGKPGEGREIGLTSFTIQFAWKEIPLSARTATDPNAPKETAAGAKAPAPGATAAPSPASSGTPSPAALNPVTPNPASPGAPSNNVVPPAGGQPKAAGQ